MPTEGLAIKHKVLTQKMEEAPSSLGAHDELKGIPEALVERRQEEELLVRRKREEAHKWFGVPIATTPCEFVLLIITFAFETCCPSATF